MAVRALAWQSHGFSLWSAELKREIQPAVGTFSVAAHLQIDVGFLSTSDSDSSRRGRRTRGGLVPGRRFRDRKPTYCCRTWKRAFVVARLFDPEDFDPAKLSVSLENSSSSVDDARPNQFLPRAYTLTHSDVTGQLHLSIGPCYNQTQLDSWYTRLMRDEIVAEWKLMNGQFSLHIHCHISGGHPLLAPAALRNRIFQREMPLVLQAIRYGDGVLLARHPVLDASTVWVHFHSVHEEFDRADCWGPLFYAAISDGLKSAAAQPGLPPLLDNGNFDSDRYTSWVRSGSRLVESDATRYFRFLRLATVSSERAATIILTVSTLFILRALTVT